VQEAALVGFEEHALQQRQPFLELAESEIQHRREALPEGLGGRDEALELREELIPAFFDRGFEESFFIAENAY